MRGVGIRDRVRGSSSPLPGVSEPPGFQQMNVKIHPGELFIP